MRLRFLLPLALMLLLSACAKQPSLPEVSSEQAAAVWGKYLTLPESTEPYRINLSLRYGPQDDTRRVTAILWSNGTGPVRLDVSAGMGALVARLAENGADFKALSPRENRAWVYTATDPYDTTPRVLINFGLPLPFGLTHMADLMQGNFTNVFGLEEGGKPENGANDSIRYTLHGQSAGTLTLQPTGLPASWSGRGWDMDFAYDEATPGKPEKISLRHADGVNAILLVKTREKPQAPYTPAQLRLDIPNGVAIRDITANPER